jgi:gluconokinase
MTGASSSCVPNIVVMGVAGSGKSVVGKAIAVRLGARFVEGDDLHPPENVAKMSRGVPLDDEDRLPWLETVARKLSPKNGHHAPTVAACSALKRSYRDILRKVSKADLLFVFLDGPARLIQARLIVRKNHFMPVSLFESQLRTIERPTGDENWIGADISLPRDTIADDVVARICVRGSSG